MTPTESTRLGTILAGIALAILCLPTLGAAQSTVSPTRVGWLNMQQILKDTPGYVVAESTFTREVRGFRSEEHTSELQSRGHLVCRLLLEKKKRWKRMERS